MSGQLSSWDSTRLGEILPETRQTLERFSRRRSRLQWIRGASVGAFTLIVGMLIVAAIDHFVRPPVLGQAILSLMGYSIAAAVAWRMGWATASQHDMVEAARGIESMSPNLREHLVSAVELDQIDGVNGSADFRQRLQLRVAQSLSSIEVKRLLPWRLVAKWALGASSLVVVVSLLSLVPVLQMPRRLARAFLPIVPIERASITAIRVRQPDPLSKMVAEGDLVAVVVDVQRLGNGQVTIEFDSEDGGQGEIRMAPRSAAESSEPPSSGAIDGSKAGFSSTHSQTFAANLQVGSSVLSYRILAGDAETLWHTLTPRFRPRIVEFEKRIRYPSYAKLPDEISKEDFGDIQAILGSTAEVTVRFDQGVEAATAQFSEGGGEVALEAVADDATRWTISIPVKTASSYRVDAKSIESGLNNPFTPRCTIDPIIDRPPTASWDEATPARRIVSPAAVIAMSGSAEDDLPIDFAIHQIVLDNGEIYERRLPLDPAVREPAIGFEWDMAAWNGKKSTEVLRRGSNLKTRLIAVDRAGHRGESAWVEVLIAGQDFQADRHSQLFERQLLCRQVTAWWASVLQLTETLEQSLKDSRSLPPSSAAVEDLRQAWEKMSPMDSSTDQSMTIAKLLQTLDDSVLMDHWSALDQSADQTLRRLLELERSWLAESKLAGEDDSQKRRAADQAKNQASRLVHVCKRAFELPPAMLAVELAVALRGDLMAAAQTAAELGDEESEIPVTRLPSQAELLMAQLREVDQLIQDRADDLPQSTNHHLQQLRRFLTDSVRRIDEETDRMSTVTDPHPETPFRQTLRSIAEQIQAQSVHAILDGQSFNTIAASVRDLTRENGMTDGELVRLADESKLRDRATQQLSAELNRNDKDSSKIARLRDELELRTNKFASLRDDVMAMLRRGESRQRMRRDADLQMAADLNLIRRAVEHVAASNPEIAPEAMENLQKIPDASRTLAAGGIFRQSSTSLQSISDRERFGDDQGDLAVRQGMRLEHFHVIVEQPLNDLRRHGVDPAVIDRLHETRWKEDYSHARDLITSRRWDGKPIVSAAGELERMADRFRDEAPQVEPILAAARKTLRDMLPSLAEEARQAADAAARTRQAIDQNNAPEEASEAMESLREEVADVAEQLIDRSNLADLADESQRQEARDADQALAAISEQTRQNPKDLEALENTLRATAEHFEKLDAQQDASESREALQQAISPDNPPDDSLAAEMQAAQSTSAAAQKSPEELLRALENELKKNPPMQNELSDISERIVSDAEKSIRRAAEQERSLQHSLERSDDEFNERKTELRERMSSLLNLARGVEQQWMAVAQTAASRGQNDSQREKFEEARKSLREATERAQQAINEQRLMNELGEAASAFADEVAKSAEQAEAAAATQPENASQLDDRQRKQLAKELEADAKRTQNDWLNTMRREQQQWKHRTDQAGQRVRQSEAEKRQAEEHVRNAEKQLEKHQGEAWAEDQLQQGRERLQTVKDSIESRTRTRNAMLKETEAADQRYEQSKSMKVPELQSDDPASEAATNAAQRAAAELEQIAQQMAQANQEAVEQSQLKLAPNTSEQLSQSQRQTRQSVERAAEELQRAARHEERLGRREAATRLDEAANAIEQTAESTMADAEELLAKPSSAESDGDAKNPAIAPEANSQLGRASEQLEQHAEVLSGLNSQPSAEQQEPPSGSAAQERSAKLARTLDELDRALNQSAPSNEPGDASQPAPDSGASSASASSENGQPANAGQASPTLSEAAEDALRKLAQARQEQLSPITGQPQPGQANEPGQPGQPGKEGQPGQPAPAGPPAPPGTQSGDNSQMPSGGFLDVDDTSRLGDDWATLRNQETTETIQDRKTTIPPAYRNAVRAYFEAIATEAARGK